jgi:hypothetical protein
MQEDDHPTLQHQLIEQRRVSAGLFGQGSISAMPIPSPWSGVPQEGQTVVRRIDPKNSQSFRDWPPEC